MEIKETKLRQFLNLIESNDKKLSEELNSIRKKDATVAKARALGPVFNVEGAENFESFPGKVSLETIVLKVGRPVLTVFGNAAQLDFSDAESEVWRERLNNAKDQLTTAIQSVGRIELQHHPFYDWVGTGWLVSNNIVVTNRHVAELFGRQNGAGFVFRQGTPGKIIDASIDLLEEEGNDSEFTFRIRKILHIEPEPGPDMAFLGIDPVSNNTPQPPPIILEPGDSEGTYDIVVLGYPARDSRIPDQQLMERIFGDVYEKKRLAPGMVTRSLPDKLFHDCSTLGGCSGGSLINLKTGNAVGLHFAGRFLESNFAVPSSIISQRLKKIDRAVPVPNGKSEPITMVHRLSESVPVPLLNQPSAPSGSFSFTIPLHVSITLGEGATATPAQVVTTQPGITNALPKSTSEQEEDFAEEAKPEDYKNRKGYDAAFLGDNFVVPLPEITGVRRKNDILTYKLNGEDEHVLRYEHFSVVMSKARRMCFFSAVNINGRTTKKFPRVGWRLDPRIPKDAQIMKECYGDPPKFSRGHMTRREDPVWGPEEAAMRGNADSMVVTNTTPQMQSFNAPIWLALEDYALDHSRDDRMRISVFTGPVMRAGDSVRFGVKIPVLFWKVIAFVHDETGNLCATGYKMSQQDQLPEEEFVFGAFQTAQTSLASIERLTGLSFGDLTKVDGFGTTNEAMEIAGTPLSNLEQIKFF